MYANPDFYFINQCGGGLYLFFLVNKNLDNLKVSQLYFLKIEIYVGMHANGFVE